MTQTCLRHHPISIGEQEGYTTYTYPDKTTISINKNYSSQSKESNDLPFLKVSTNQSKKQIEKALLDSGFKKRGEIYQRGTNFNQSITTCTLSKASHNTLLSFSKNYPRN